MMITQQKNELALIGKYMAEHGSAKAAEITSRHAADILLGTSTWILHVN